jgi:hypothetical protein
MRSRRLRRWRIAEKTIGMSAKTNMIRIKNPIERGETVIKSSLFPDNNKDVIAGEIFSRDALEKAIENQNTPLTTLI